MKVLVLCSGNVCRSPMAAAYLRHRAGDSGLAHLVVDSAGTLGIEGAPATSEVVRVLAERGVALGEHRSRGVRPVDLRTADYVLVMELAHLAYLESGRQRPTGEVHLLREFENGPHPSPGAPDLPDPIGRPIEDYRASFEIISRCVDHFMIHLRAADRVP